VGDPARAIEAANRALSIMDYGVGRNTLAEAHTQRGHDLLWQNRNIDEALKRREGNPDAGAAELIRNTTAELDTVSAMAKKK
jgi:hypothetical protein